MRSVVELSMRTMVSGYWFVQVVWTIRILGAVVLL